MLKEYKKKNLLFILNTTEDTCNQVTILICKRGNKFNFGFRVRLHAVAVQ